MANGFCRALQGWLGKGEGRSAGWRNGNRFDGPRWRAGGRQKGRRRDRCRSRRRKEMISGCGSSSRSLPFSRGECFGILLHAKQTNAKQNKTMAVNLKPLGDRVLVEPAE